MSVIEVHDLYKFYKAGKTVVKALNGVSFSIEKGEFVAIIGPSGSGKSTLLNMLAGLESPTKGEIIIGGRHIEGMSENDLVGFRRRNVGFIFQSYNLIPTMNAIENVALPLMFKGVPKKAREAEAIKYLKLVGLEDSMKNLGNAMSGGQQQRVGIARALTGDPKIIFADEPTGNLDTKTSAEVLKLLKDVCAENQKTLIMVTHSPAIAKTADRQITIVDGKIVESGVDIV
ncbi:MAG: ABC transporter ATP-binding protein [Lachnospiraceae bacterium]|nr:ABC transporter ATP-binding protein [Lachnospiraceae bacterium]